MSTLHVESAGAGAPIVLLHGWAMHGAVWGPLVPTLARRFRVHVADLPGHGHSGAVKPFTLETIVAAVAQRFGAQDAAPTVLGWSFGATVAMAWAARGGVARLVLVGATPRFVAAPDWPYAMAAATLARFHDELRVAYRDTLNRFLALQTHGSEHGRAALHALRAHLFVRGEPDAAVLQSGLDVLARADLRDTVREIAAPALVVVGGRDTLTPPQAGEWLARALPNARLARIEGAAHAPFLSHPREFAAALDRFTGG